jgi:hypothetical protein
LGTPTFRQAPLGKSVVVLVAAGFSLRCFPCSFQNPQAKACGYIYFLVGGAHPTSASNFKLSQILPNEANQASFHSN